MLLVIQDIEYTEKVKENINNKKLIAKVITKLKDKKCDGSIEVY